jgi:membrane-associated phospholipid phosphatase
MRATDDDASPYTCGDVFRWTLTWLVAGVNAVWLLVTHLSVVPAGIVARAVVGANLVCILVLLALIRQARRKRGAAPVRFSRQLELTIHTILYWSLTSSVLGLFQYLLVTINTPLMDQTLNAIDTAMGFDWVALNSWVQSHPSIGQILYYAYYSIGYQCAIIALFFCLRYDVRRLGAFNSLATLTTLLTVLISAPFPAHTASIYHHAASAAELASQADFDALRSSMSVIDLNAMQGIITMPSLHAALAFILGYSVRGTILFVPIAATNVVMAFSTLTVGGHYLIDTIAGIGVAVLAVSMLGALARKREAAIPARVLAEA